MEQKILNDIPLSQEELRTVEQALVSGAMKERILACEALLRAGEPDSTNRAVQAVRTIIEDVNSGNIEPDPNLIMTFFCLPLEVLDQSIFQSALIRCASHADEGVRANVMIVLGRLAKSGSGWAVGLLKAATKDANDFVRQNAMAGLRLGALGGTSSEEEI